MGQKLDYQPPSEDDIEVSALGMITNHGEDAEAQARAVAAKMTEQNDHEGARTWLAIAKEISLLR